MSPVSPDIAKQFCELCNWAYECWITHKQLFDDNSRIETTIGKAPYFTERLSVITQEYCLLQICKLHDPAIQGGRVNITIDYIMRCGDWSADTDQINKYARRLTALFKELKPARDRVLAHNDFETALASARLGMLLIGSHEEYFSTLQELVNAVSKKWLGGPYPFNDLAGADVSEFLQLLEKSKPISSVD